MSLDLTLRDLDLLETLTSRVRMLTAKNCADLWGGAHRRPRSLQRRLERLAMCGWIEIHVVNAHPPLATEQPVFAWRPGEDEPDAECIAAELRSRWRQAAQPVQVCVASAQAACLLGSTARGLPPREHYDHDLRLAAVYVHYRKSCPSIARLWIGEHVLPKAGYRIKDPDAFLVEHGRTLRVIESGGRYGPAQIDSFHDHCAEHQLPYELW